MTKPKRRRIKRKVLFKHDEPISFPPKHSKPRAWASGNGWQYREVTISWTEAGK